MGALKGDFISFRFGEYHSSDLGIIRTSDGSRFNKNLFPTIQDKTVQVPGADGTYFFGSYHTQRQFNIPVAFDNLSEAEYVNIQRIFGTKEITPLIFDEEPYKYYMVKTTGTPQFKTICFDEEEVNIDSNGHEIIQIKRVYKGEGTLNFVAYFPYAHTRRDSNGKPLKFLNQYYYHHENDYTIPEWENWRSSVSESGLYGYKDESNSWFYGNRNEWRAASGMLEDNELGGKLIDGSLTQGNGYIWLYNPGSIEVDFKLYLNLNSNHTFPGAQFICAAGHNPTSATNIVDRGLEIQTFAANTSDSYIVVDSKSNLLRGADADFNLTGNLYNEHITIGNFFKIPLGISHLRCNNTDIQGTIEYDYLYY